MVVTFSNRHTLLAQTYLLEQAHPYSSRRYRAMWYEPICGRYSEARVDGSPLKKKQLSIESHLTFKASYVAECTGILMDMEICLKKKGMLFVLEAVCISAPFLHLPCSLLSCGSPVWLTCKHKYQHTHTHTQVLLSRCCGPALRIAGSLPGWHPIARVRKQTAHNIIGNCTTWQHRVTRPVTPETPIHPIAVSCTLLLLAERTEACDWWLKRCCLPR